ncbi:filamentous hemagglutinin N-terminal domain-containing protein [Methylacidimicrobium sp. B4]|uniref:beta strand repeat-containing protein n=1 Tax=Methylacidimicrobium sp. B4 TaxID=2796139 RepID=UPI001A8FAD21|nr:filamentous hemagglutinin N-terminal domain-containing protein [Methylacidimicrobium sp. B4]QSR84383.1 filamentous hemagglutinin N-terminal domain-containing protein [Methylacidimicrobium sp. B4]
MRTLLATALSAALALGWVSAQATVVAPLQLPGHGSVVAGSASTTGNYGAGGTGHIMVGAANTVINWGNSGGTIGTGQPGGFNIGGSGHLVITNPGQALLNVDVTGSPSQILGMLNANGPVFVANANGITVGSGAMIVAPAGINLIAATVDEQLFASTGQLPIRFAASGPLTVAGNLVAAGGPGSSIFLAGSGAVNILPIPNGAAHYFKPGTNVTVVGGVGGTLNTATGIFTPADGAGSATPSASSPTTVTLNLGTSAHPYDLRLSGPNGATPTVGTLVLANGNIVNNGVLTNSTGNVVPYLQWTGTLTNNGTLQAQVDAAGVAGLTTFYGNTPSLRPYGSLVNNGTIATNSSAPLYIRLPGSVTNSSGATISNVGGDVRIDSGYGFANLASGGIVNHGSIVALDNVTLIATNNTGSGLYPMGGVYSDGSIRILDSAAHANAALTVGSTTGNAFLGGTVTTPNDAAGLANVYLFSGAKPPATFTLGTNLKTNAAQFTGGSLTGGGTLTTNTLFLDDFVGNVNNVTSPTNDLANGFHVANGSSGNTNLIVSLPTTSQGAIGRQVVNLNVAGNATLFSHTTSTFVNGSGSTGTLPTEANVGSSLLVQASGNLTVNPSASGPLNYAFSSGALGTHGFVFPGGIVLIAGNTLSLNTVVDNGYAPTVGAGQGIFFQAPKIITTGAPVITNGNAWVNFSTQPSIVPAIYGVAAVSGSTTNFTIVPDASAFHIRPYTP